MELEHDKLSLEYLERKKKKKSVLWNKKPKVDGENTIKPKSENGKYDVGEDF